MEDNLKSMKKKSHSLEKKFGLTKKKRNTMNNPIISLKEKIK